MIAKNRLQAVTGSSENTTSKPRRFRKFFTRKKRGRNLRRITLVWPPSNQQKYRISIPFGIALVAQACKNAGYEVTLIHSDAHFLGEELMDQPQRTNERLSNLVAGTDPDLLGVGAWTFHMPFVIEFTNSYKALHPETPIVLGGLNATFLPEETLRSATGVDYLVRGEGHIVLPQLIRALNTDAESALPSVRGISYRAATSTHTATENRKEGNGSGTFVHTPSEPLTVDLDTLPLIDFSYLEKRAGNFFIMQTSIGCPHHCSFCCVHDLYGKYKQHSLSFVDRQLQVLEQKFGNIYVQFLDDYALYHRKRANALLEMLAAKHPALRWELLTRIESINEPIAKQLKRSGCVGAWLGFESMIPETLRFYNKTNSPERYVRKLDEVMTVMEAQQIFTAVPFLLGAPNETVEDYKATRAFAERIDETHDFIYSCLGLIMVYPNTTLWERVGRGELKLFQFSEGMNVSEALFDEKYRDHNELAPHFWMFENGNMTNAALEATILKYAKEAITTRFLRGDIQKLSQVAR